MLILHENDEQYIYYAIVNTQDDPKYTWDEYASSDYFSQLSLFNSFEIIVLYLFGRQSPIN